MKKLIKFLGLLLVAGAMFVGCQQEANIDTNEVKLSNGKWDIVSSMSTKIKKGLYTGTLSYGSSETINVSGDTYTYISYSGNQSVSFTLPEGTDETALRTLAALMTGGGEDDEDKPTVTINGTTLTITDSYTATAEEIEEMNEEEHKISEDYTSELPEGVVIKTNKKKTEYIVTWVVAAEDEDDFDSNYTMTMKKQK